ncbi:MAG: type II toxin-antitoxin system RelE/ParE family toxin [Bacteroidales bacterium]|nr:type II toxin-antitoxin system RelE/ParE family toxin [Bacteroidales bacterium]MBS3776071.1 type II toxin-antitoxin system RelE/ParE family toxin [Bacteroidales bacterium]
MKIKYKKQYLADLYCGKKVRDKRFRSDPKLVSQYQKTVSKLIKATRIEQLYQFKSLNYEKLSGKLKGKSSVRINKQYRLIFTEIPANEPPYEIEIIELEEISKHYEN